MSEHKVSVNWSRESDDFQYKNYNREHTWNFENGIVVQASAAPDYLGKAECVNPEDAYVASLSSCHMLTFLAIASYQGFTIDSYVDEAVGILDKNESGRMAVTQVTLKPTIQFSGEKVPSDEELNTLHDKAHRECFIANSVTTEVNLDTRGT